MQQAIAWGNTTINSVNGVFQMTAPLTVPPFTGSLPGANNSVPTVDLVQRMITDSGGVTSFNGRTGSVTPASGDYTTTQVTEGTNLYYTNARADARISLQKGQPNGLATLGADSKLDPGQLPALAITETFVVSTQAAMLALAAQQGDVCVRTDLHDSFILTTNDPTILANWQQLETPVDGVASFNGRTGSVVPATNDYTFAQIGSKPTTLGGYGITDAATAAQGAKADSAMQPDSDQTVSGLKTFAPGGGGVFSNPQSASIICGARSADATRASIVLSPTTNPANALSIEFAVANNAIEFRDWNNGAATFFSINRSGDVTAGSLTVNGAISATNIGTAAAQPASAFATAAQGAKADSAVQPGSTPTFAGIAVNRNPASSFADVTLNLPGAPRAIKFMLTPTPRAGIYDATNGVWLYRIDSDNSAFTAGSLTVNGAISATNIGTAAAQPASAFATAAQGALAASAVQPNTSPVFSGVSVAMPPDFWATSPALFNATGFIGTNGSYALSLRANGYRNSSGGWTSMGVAGFSNGSGVDFMPDGSIQFYGGAPSGMNPPVVATFDASGNFSTGWIASGYIGIGTVPNRGGSSLAVQTPSSILLVRDAGGTLSLDVVNHDNNAYLPMRFAATGYNFTGGNITAPNLSGTNTGDETATTIKSKLGITTLSGTNTGDQDLSGYMPVNAGSGKPFTIVPYINYAGGGGSVRVPRIFVQSADPGAAAFDGDLWFW